MNGVKALESDISGYVEVDPTGRYGRYSEVLGKGASKTVYKAFDDYEGIEVAWNQVKLTDFLQRPEDLERLYSEIHLLRTLNHSNIIKFYASWVDTANRNINFVTEMFTSGTLRQYRLKHKKVNIRAVKHWCRQILEGLLYLHSLDPPVIHRDLKCDNIFINGNQGQVKIGDLGLAAILRKSYAARCVGTPEFMAPEVYKEEYNELVDIYSFGMCVLEMITFEYPYSECTHPAQIYKKVISGIMPEALYKVKNPEVRRFIGKCLATVSSRLPASELLNDPFLQMDGKGYYLRPIAYQRDCDQVGPLMKVLSHDARPCYGSLTNSGSDYPDNELDNEFEEYEAEEEKFGPSEIDLFMSPDHGHLAGFGITIKGKKTEDGQIFLRLRIADKEGGRVRNIYFPFDTDNDTALSVATEMVSELDIIEQEVTEIAEMIDSEIATLVTGWNRGLSIEEGEQDDTNLNHMKHSTSNQHLSNHFSPEKLSSQNFLAHCSGHTSGRGRFEEITYLVEPSRHQSFTHGATAPAATSSQYDGTHRTDIWHQHLSLRMDDSSRSENGDFRTPYNSPVSSTGRDDHDNRVRNELRWVKVKYQMQLRELRDHQLGSYPGGFEEGYDKNKPSSAESNCGSSRKKLSCYLSDDGSQDSDFKKLLRSCAATSSESKPLVNRKDIYKEVLLSHSMLHRAASLPVDAVDC
ncbi:hypothetical protein V2J09_023165 [Rumex salicifolius]